VTSAQSLKVALKQLEDEIKLFRPSRGRAHLPEKLKLEREKLSARYGRDEAWKEYEQAAKKVRPKGLLNDEVESD